MCVKKCDALKRFAAAGYKGNKKSLTVRTIRLSCYVNGLVSTGKQNSLHNIKKNFITKEKFYKKFYSQAKKKCG
jgi:hypothetical protein